MEPSKLPIIGYVIERLRNRSDHESVKMAMASKGDITRMAGYDNMYSCLKRLSGMNGENTMGRPFRAAWQAHSILSGKDKPAFEAAFKTGGAESIRLIYANAVTALWHLTSLLCVEAVEIVKGPDGSLSSVPSKTGAENLVPSIFVTRLEQFVDAAGKYGFDVAVSEGAALVESTMLREGIASGIMNYVSNNSKEIAIKGVIAGLLLLLLLARDLAEKFYSLRGTFSRWLEVQAQFLEMNAAQLGATKAAPRAKQEEYAAKFRALAERIRADNTDTERDAVKGIQQSDRDIETEVSGSSGYSGAPRLL